MWTSTKFQEKKNESKSYLSVTKNKRWDTAFVLFEHVDYV